uniref:Uncharacterized protein n=1 Tax=Oryza glumipatula TaxID=40148 RepID=A0A0D9Z2P9_9ORYZ
MRASAREWLKWGCQDSRSSESKILFMPHGPDASALISVLVLPDSLRSNNTYSVTHACIDYQAPQDMGCGCQMIGEETSQHRDTAESDTHHEAK